MTLTSIKNLIIGNISIYFNPYTNIPNSNLINNFINNLIESSAESYTNKEYNYGYTFIKDSKIFSAIFFKIIIEKIKNENIIQIDTTTNISIDNIINEENNTFLNEFNINLLKNVTSYFESKLVNNEYFKDTNTTYNNIDKINNIFLKIYNYTIILNNNQNDKDFYNNFDKIILYIVSYTINGYIYNNINDRGMRGLYYKYLLLIEFYNRLNILIKYYSKSNILKNKYLLLSKLYILILFNIRLYILSFVKYNETQISNCFMRCDYLNKDYDTTYRYLNVFNLLCPNLNNIFFFICKDYFNTNLNIINTKEIDKTKIDTYKSKLDSYYNINTIDCLLPQGGKRKKTNKKTNKKHPKKTSKKTSKKRIFRKIN